MNSPFPYDTESLKTPATHYNYLSINRQAPAAHLYYIKFWGENMNTIINLIEKPTISSGATGFICRFLAEQPSTCRFWFFCSSRPVSSVLSGRGSCRSGCFRICCARCWKRPKLDTKVALSALQALIVSTATRVGMGNLVGIVAALSAGGFGALFWMWVTALLGSATAFIEGDLSPASQTAGSALRRLPRRSCLLHSRLDQQQTPETGNAGFEEKFSLRTVCALRS